jgi:hypothetical protein
MTNVQAGVVEETPAFLNSKPKTIKGMTGKELVSLVVAMIQGSKVASRWDSVNDYPKASDVKQLVAKSDGLFDFVLKVMSRYCPSRSSQRVRRLRRHL